MLWSALLCLLLFYPIHFAEHKAASASYTNSSRNDVTFTNTSSFRVAYGERVENMNEQGLGNLVRLIVKYEVFDRNGEDGKVVHEFDQQSQTYEPLEETYYCSGMAVTAHQLRGGTFKSSGGFATTPNASPLQAHCVEPVLPHPDPENERELRLKEVLVVSGSEHVGRPSRVQNHYYGYKFERPIEKQNVRYVEKFSWYYPGDKGHKISKIDQYSGEFNDIAILKLRGDPFMTPLTELEFNEPEKLPGETCRFAGWGLDHNETDDGWLKLVKPEDNQLLDRDQCLNELLRSWPAQPDEYWKDKYDRMNARARIKYDSNVLCTSNMGSSPCSGDSGAPLFCKTPPSEEKIRGIFSHTSVTIRSRKVVVDDTGLEKDYLAVEHCNKQYPDRFQLFNHYVNLSNKTTKDWIRECIEVLEGTRVDTNQRCNTVTNLVSVCLLFDGEVNGRQRRQAKECQRQGPIRPPKDAQKRRPAVSAGSAKKGVSEFYVVMAGWAVLLFFARESIPC